MDRVVHLIIWGDPANPATIRDMNSIAAPGGKQENVVAEMDPTIQRWYINTGCLVLNKHYINRELLLRGFDYSPG